MLTSRQLTMALDSQNFDHLKQFIDLERIDFEETFLENELVQLLAGDDVFDVAAKDSHRQRVARVGGKHDVEVFRPQGGQPRQTTGGDGRLKVIQTIDEKN